MRVVKEEAKKIIHFEHNVFEEGLDDKEYEELFDIIRKFKEKCINSNGKFSIRIPKIYGYKRIELICSGISQLKE